MIDASAIVLAQADEHHLHQAAFDIADEAGMRLDAVADDDVIGVEGVLIEVDGKALGGFADDHRVHAGPNRAPAKRFGDAVAGQDANLLLGGSAAVAAHGRHDERLTAQAPHVPNDFSEHQGDVGDAAAAGGDGDALPC